MILRRHQACECRVAAAGSKAGSRTDRAHWEGKLIGERKRQRKKEEENKLDRRKKQTIHIFS